MPSSLRSKHIFLLVLTGVLPLAVGLCFLLLEGRLVKRREVGLRYRAMAEARSETLRAALHENIALAVTVARSPFCMDIAREFSDNVPLDSARATQIDSMWSNGGKNSLPELDKALNNPSAEALRRILEASHRSEMFITDRFGRVVACSEPTSDYLQADEVWWRECFNGGQPQIYVSNVNFDHSANLWSIDIAAPILDRQGHFFGVCKTIVDLERWISAVHSGRLSEHDTFMFIDSGGNVLHGGDLDPYSSVFPLENHEDELDKGCWHFEGKNLNAFAPMDLGAQIEGIPLACQRWFVVIQTPVSEAMAVVYNLLLLIVVSGVVVILMAFVVGYVISDRQVIRPLEKLKTAAEKLAGGHFGHRIELEEKSFLNSELINLFNEFNSMAQAVEDSRKQLELAAEMKSRFIKIASHELKTPVAYIMAMSGLLVKKADGSELKDSAANIEKRAKRLDQIVSGMLKLAAEGNFDFQSDLTLEQCDVLELVDSVASAIKPFSDQRGQKLEIIREFDESLEITIDYNKILDALLNLLSNAIKFTPDEGTITLRLGMDDVESVRIEIEDQGSGIDPKDLQYIFEPFWGGGNILHHSSGDFGFEKRGPGLGLPVAKHFIDMHGGNIKVSTSSDGCVFTVTLPLSPLYQSAD